MPKKISVLINNIPLCVCILDPFWSHIRLSKCPNTIFRLPYHIVEIVIRTSYNLVHISFFSEPTEKKLLSQKKVPPQILVALSNIIFVTFQELAFIQFALNPFVFIQGTIFLVYSVSVQKKASSVYRVTSHFPNVSLTRLCVDTMSAFSSLNGMFLYLFPH